MNRSEVQHWIDTYVGAWRSAGTDKLAEIFTEDIMYQVSPWKRPFRGFSELRPFWENARSGPDEIFKLKSDIVAVEGNTAVAKIEVTYADDQPSRWRDLWILTFANNGRCCRFEEWPFSPNQNDGQEV